MRSAATSRKVEIVRRAAEIFDSKGVAETSIEDIAVSIGIRREAVYHYFRDKGEILCDIIRPQSEALLRGMERLMTLDLSPRVRLTLAISAHLERFNPHYIEMTVAFRELYGRSSTPGLIELRRVWKSYEQLWIDLVVEGQKAGEFDETQNAKMAAFGILGMCNWASSWYRPGGDMPIEKLIESFTAIAMGGIASRTNSCRDCNSP